MGAKATLPKAIAECAERRTWFPRLAAEEVLTWCEENAQKFLGMDVAQKNSDGTWTLLIDPILDLSDQTDNFEAIRRGRLFLAENDGEGRMFDPVWKGRST
uniref:hypothetical protein n=1 Tax=Parerythrobacter lutipelagi TaxID=1964208 RepID=UPI0010F965B3|nr:hypothetical protein [Parerythrobacter lutipelagi]